MLISRKGRLFSIHFQLYFKLVSIALLSFSSLLLFRFFIVFRLLVDFIYSFNCYVVRGKRVPNKYPSIKWNKLCLFSERCIFSDFIKRYLLKRGLDVFQEFIVYGLPKGERLFSSVHRNCICLRNNCVQVIICRYPELCAYNPGVFVSLLCQYVLCAVCRFSFSQKLPFLRLRLFCLGGGAGFLL